MMPRFTTMLLNSHGIFSATRSTIAVRPASWARLATGSLIAVPLISPDLSASRRRIPPPYSLRTTSSRRMPRRASASVTVESLSDPNALTPTTPPLRSAAVLTPRPVKKVKRMTLLSDAIVRRSPPSSLSCTTAAAVHVDDLHSEALGRIEAAGLRHPQSQHRVDRLGDADLETDHFRRHHRVPPSD